MKEESFHHGRNIVPPVKKSFNNGGYIFSSCFSDLKYEYLVLSFRYHFVAYIRARNSLMWSEVMYSSYSIILSIIPFGVNSMIRLATV